MRYGAGWGCYYSDPESWIIILGMSDLGSGASVTFIGIPNYDQYYQLVIDGKNAGAPVFVKAGIVTTLKGNYAFTAGPHFVSVIGVGPYSTPDVFDVTSTQIAFTSVRADRLHFEILGTTRQFSTGDAGQFTNWAITGLNRFSTCRSVPNRPTWGALDITLSTSGGVHTLTGAIGGTTQWSGTITGNGSIALTDINGNSVGSVTLTYSADISSGAQFINAWPALYYIYYSIGQDVQGLPVSNVTWTSGIATIAVANAYNIPLFLGSATWAAGTATVSITAPAGPTPPTIAVGETVIVSGVGRAGYNGTFVVTAVDNIGGTISYTIPDPGGSSLGGHVYIPLPAVGTTINVSGISPAGYNGTGFIVTASGTSTISYALATNPGAYVSDGEVLSPQGIVYDDGKSSYFSYESIPGLAAGTYHVLVHQVNELLEESTGTTNQTQALVGVPAAPGLATYSSGGFAATVINFAASLTAGATYNIYDSLDTLVVPTEVTQTHGSGSGTLSSTLGAIGSIFTGTRYIVIRAVNAGIESSNSIAAQIVYGNGTVVLNRPNTPLMAQPTTTGRQITVPWSLDTANALITATNIQLFLSTGDTAGVPTFNYASADGTTAVSGTNRVIFGTVTATAGSDGQYWIAIRSTSANGQSLNTNYAGPFTLATATPAEAVWNVRGGV